MNEERFTWLKKALTKHFDNEDLYMMMMKDCTTDQMQELKILMTTHPHAQTIKTLDPNNLKKFQEMMIP